LIFLLDIRTDVIHNDIMGQGSYIGTLRLPQGLAEDARSLAKVQGMSLAKLVQEAIREYIHRHGVPKVLLLRNGSSAVVTVLQKDGEPEVLSQFFLGSEVAEEDVKREVEERTGFSSFTMEEL
jgi:hypothetical protein